MLVDVINLRACSHFVNVMTRGTVMQMFATSHEHQEDHAQFVSQATGEMLEYADP